MGLPNEVVSALIGAANQGVYEIEQSLRFDESARLTRSAFGSTTLNTTWTLSCWFKRGGHDPDEFLSHNLFWAQAPGGSSNTGTVIIANDPRYTSRLMTISSTYSDTTFVEPPGTVRDQAGWYHLVIKSVGTTGNQANISYYMNGELRLTTSNTPEAYFFGYPRTPYIGGTSTVGTYGGGYLGYMAEVHYIHGTAKNHTDFGEYDNNGVWRPIKYTGGSYGTNGFYLTFDPSATNGIGHDHSGNGNHFTPSGFNTSGSTGSSGSDVVSDTPTNVFAILNAGMKRQDRDLEKCVKNGGLQFKKNDGNNQYIASSIACPGSGKWYFEFTVNVHNLYVGVAEDGTWTDVAGIASNSVLLQMDSSSNYYIRNYYTSATQNLSGEASSGQVYSMRYDADNGTVAFYNASGTQFGSTVTGLTTGVERFFFISGQSGAESYCNFGQQDWAHTLPSGYQALCTANLPAPNIADGSQYFDIALDTGANIRSTAQSTFSNGLWWIKDRVNSNQHQFLDSQRGTTTAWTQPESVAQKTYVAPSGNSVAWSWSAPDSWSNSAGTNGATVASSGYRNQSAGFSVAQFTGQRPTTVKVAHGLNTTPDFIITRHVLGTSYSAFVYHKETGTQYGNWFDGTYGGSGSADYVTVNSQYVEHGNSANNNETGTNGMIMYCWSSIPGYSAFGKYTGNSSTEGPFIYTGFKPRWIMTRGLYTSGAPSDYNWRILDTERDPYNGAWNMLWANKADYEAQNVDSNNIIDILSNGFKIRTNSVEVNNSSGPNYIWAAWAENPFGGDGVTPVTAR